MNPGIRMDAGLARYMAAQSRNGKVQDFMPWPIEEEPEATPEAVLLLLKSSKKVKTPT